MSSPGSSDYMRMGRRDSASSSTKRSSRPRLLRASATEPSLSASTATHGALASPPHSSSRRATDILNRVAYISGTSPPSGQSPLYEGMNERNDTLSSSPTSHSTDEYYTRPPPKDASERYFSFPSFDTWEGQEDNKDNEDKSGD
ncbi:hypothetical protein OOU_Y34scaffold00140g17 [Pyricularia oryzae Y34]|uniref:Uncharacterized protein n=2 Tax=Pyricularia oryzae TaxID=318829 RepID=A0AA97PQW7_PYRO3|nr:hypothetical protein OOU_Y34scaffold00140g17 [Pyricularia oryzae Y34]